MPYAPHPGTRIPIDVDGTVILIQDRTTGDWYETTPEEKRLMSVERGYGIGIRTYNGSDFGWNNTSLGQGEGTRDLTRAGVIVMLFPTAMRLTGIINAVSWQYSSYSPYYVGVHRAEVWVSPDSTNGSDGNWTKIREWEPDAMAATPSVTFGNTARFKGLPTTDTLVAQPMNDAYRKPFSENPMGFVELGGAAVRNVRAVRFALWCTTASHLTGGFTPKYMLFGHPDTGALDERVDFWRADSDSRILSTTMDWGDVPVSSTAQKTFRIKNMSSDKTATTVEISALRGASEANPTVQGFFTFSMDEINWGPTVTLASLSPGTVSPVIYVRRVVPENAQLSNWSPRIVATVEEWV